MKKKFLLSFMITTLCFLIFGAISTSASEIVSEGSCGLNLFWSLDSKGTLTIGGSGDMTSWESSSSVPWNRYRDSISRLIIKEDVTSIGKHAFENCEALTQINWNAKNIADFSESNYAFARAGTRWRRNQCYFWR